MGHVPRRSGLALALVLAAGVVAGLLPFTVSDRADAGCTNYEEYLHWISSLELEHKTESISIQGDYTYLVESHEGIAHLTIVDITNESIPVVANRHELPYNSTRIVVSGAVAAISNGSDAHDGLYMVDISDHSAPEIVGSALPGIRGTEIIMADTLVYLLHNRPPDFSLMIVDVTDPTSPVLSDSLQLPYQPTGRMHLRGNYIYLGAVQLTTVDVSDPYDAFVADTDGLDPRSFRDIDIDGDYLFASTRHLGYNADLRAYSLADPSNPVEVGMAETTLGSSHWAYVATAAGVAFFGADTEQVWMFDISNPTAMSFIGYLPDVTQYLRRLQVHGSDLYTMRSGPGNIPGYLSAFSASSPSPMEAIGSIVTPGEALDVKVATVGRASLAYVADGASGVVVVDVTDPINPVMVDTIDTPGYATDIELAGTMAYVADGSEGLQVIDTSIASVVGSVDTPGIAVDLVVVDTLAYVADSSEGLRIIDISDPSLPILRGAETALLSAQGVDVLGGVAYVADGGQGLQSVDVSDPDNPWIIDGVKHREVSNAKKVDVVGDRAYVTDTATGLVTVDIGDPANLSILSSVTTDREPDDVNLLGLFAFVGSGSGVRLFDVQDGANPVSVGSVAIPENARGIFANADYAYVAAGAAGLQVCPTQCGFDETVTATFSASPESDYYPVTVAFTNQSVGYGMSYAWDFGDSVGTSTEKDPTYTYTVPGAYTVTLETTNGTDTEIATAVVSALSDPPYITSVTDIPDDQGGYVYLRFYRSSYDDDPLTRSEMYTIQRMDDAGWVSLHTIGAFGEHYYVTEARTQGDGAEWDTQFRVIAHMDEGNWAGDPMSGHSLDNIAPEVPQGLSWLTWGHLVWDAAPDVDFAYYQVYGSPTADFADAEPVDATVDPEVTVDPVAYARYFVVAVDDSDLESDPAVAPEETGIEGAVTEVKLSQAVPSPFNPNTVIGYAIPANGHVQLRVFDVGGRLVRTLVDEETPAGRHGAIWRGRDDSGRAVASGIYFYQLEAGGKSLRKSMTLLK